jgi:hypothetical protein
MCQITDLYRYINDGGWRGCYRRVNAPASGRNHWRNDDVISSARPAAHSLPAVLYNIYILYHILASRFCCRRIPPFYPCPHTSLLASESIIVLLCLVAIHLHKN